MDQAILTKIQELLEQLIAKPDGTVTAAAITVVGMFGVAAIGAFVQWLVTRTVMRSEHERLRIQLQGEFHLRQFEQWQSRLQEIIADLLKETDPEVTGAFNRDRIVPLILRAQLMLNLKEASHWNVNDLINQLGLAVNGWHGPQDTRTILAIHSKLLDAARDLIAARIGR